MKWRPALELGCTKGTRHMESACVDRRTVRAESLLPTFLSDPPFAGPCCLAGIAPSPQVKPWASTGKSPRRLHLENLERRLCLTASVGWDGIGLGSASLTYYIADVPSSVDLTEAQVRYAVETALDAWSEAADITFTETDSPDEDDCIEFSFGTIDGEGDTLAFAYFPDDINAEPLAGDVFFDKAESWEIGNGLRDEASDLVLIAAHEIGHALGLEHSYLSGSVMVATLDTDQMFGGLGSTDETAILTLYAAVPTLEVTSLALDDTIHSGGRVRHAHRHVHRRVIRKGPTR